jgi:hypothetical protein
MNFENKSLRNQNSSTFWKFIGNRLRNNADAWPSSDLSGKKLSTSSDVATAFSDYYSSVFNRTPLSDSDVLEAVCDFNPIIFSKFTLPYFIPAAISYYTKLLPNKTSAGINGLSNKFLKLFGASFAIPLSKLFNFVLFTGTVPPDWKISYITPVPKNNSPADISDYRPISLTCSDSKLFELFLKDLILEHLHNNNLIPSQQFGFFPKRSTAGNLLSYLNKVSDFVQNKIPVDVVYIDFSKAFDKVVHSILLAKLVKLGFSEQFVSVINSWLTGRIQFVKIDDAMSTAKQVLSGVPQGTVLGPVLFNVYIIDLFNLLRNTTIFCYADDSKLLMPIRDPSDNAKLQIDLQCLHLWCIKNGMSVNLTKTSVMHFGQSNPHHRYYFGEHILSTCKVTRDLGVLVDDQLKFSENVAAVAHSANKRIALIRNSFHHRAPDFHIKMFKIFVLPIIDYCSCVSMVSSVHDENILENIQRSFTRSNIFYSGNYIDRPDYETRLSTLGLIPISRRRKLLDIITLVNFINGKFYLTGLEFRYSRSNRNNDKKLWKPAAVCCRKNYWFDRTINDYNNLPALLVNSCSFDDLNSYLP